MKEFTPPLVTPSDEEPIATGGWCVFREEHTGNANHLEPEAATRTEPPVCTAPRRIRREPVRFMSRLF
jgi:hypothetical protein